MLHEEELLKLRIEELGYVSTRSSYADVAKDKDMFTRLALITIPEAQLAINLPWHREIPMDGIDY